MSVLVDETSFLIHPPCLQKSPKYSASFTMSRAWWAQWWAHDSGGTLPATVDATIVPELASSVA